VSRDHGRSALRPRAPSDARDRRSPPPARGPGHSRARAATPAVGKALEVALLVLLVALLTTTLFGGVLPTYRTAAGAELADRTLARSATAVERAVPVDGDAYRTFEHTRRVDLPGEIRGDRYAVRADDTTGRLRLVHPRAGVGGAVRPALPNGTTLAGSWRSDRATRVRANVTDGGVRVELLEGSG
jgi:hypothetical protein